MATPELPRPGTRRVFQYGKPDQGGCRLEAEVIGPARPTRLEKIFGRNPPANAIDVDFGAGLGKQRIVIDLQPEESI